MAYFQNINDMGKCSQYNAMEKVRQYIHSIDTKFQRKYIHSKKIITILIIVMELSMIMLVFFMLFYVSKLFLMNLLCL